MPGKAALWATCAVLTALAAAPAQAAFPGENGKLAAQVADVNGRSGIVTFNADGSELTVVVPPPENATQPRWSPDGSRIAFVSQAGPTFDDLITMNPDGSSRSTVADGARFPAWSPDGTKIAYWYRDLWTVPAAGGTPTKVLKLGNLNVLGSIDWSPDGQRLALDLTSIEAHCDEYDECFYTRGPTNVYTVRVDGTDLRRITDGERNTAPSWSPDGSKIAFADSDRVSVMDADGGNAHVIGEYFSSDPAWSPDGTKIAFNSGVSISSMTSDGTDAVEMISGVYSGPDTWRYGEPDWQPAPNNAPDCAQVQPDREDLWPPNNKLRSIQLSGATDLDGDTVVLAVTGVTSDETGGSDDFGGLGGDAVLLRATRDPRGDGRVYELTFRVSDEAGASCTGETEVVVPRHKP